MARWDQHSPRSGGFNTRALALDFKGARSRRVELCKHSRGDREFVEHTISDEALIDATQGIHKSLQNFLCLHHDLGKLLQRTSTLELLSIVDEYEHGLTPSGTPNPAVDVLSAMFTIFFLQSRRTGFTSI